MHRILAATILLSASIAMAGDTCGDSAGSAPANAFWHRFQVHGNLDQSVVFGSGNNYLTMNTNDGTAKWSEGSVNLSGVITENFHAGIQVHSYMMGQIGRGNLMVDWAYGDYRVKSWLGFRGLTLPLGTYR